MLQSIKTYVHDRSKGLSKTAGFIGGAYLVQQYVKDRLEELKVKIDEERAARDSLRKRFQTAQDDVSFTILALLPTLAEQIMEGMDVDTLTQELQSRSKAHATGPQQLLRQRHNGTGHDYDVNKPSQQHKPSGTQGTHESSAVDETRSEVDSMASASFIEAPSRDEESSGVNSWVETSGSERSPHALSPKGDTSSYHIPNGPQLPQLSDSVLTTITTTTESSAGNESRLSDSVVSISATSDSTSSKTKAELWTEVKMLTFTRTLTTLYSITLLSLLTTIQLTVLARSKYVNSVLEHEREERFREQLESQLSFFNLLFSRSDKLQDILLGEESEQLENDAERGELGGSSITEEVERKFLTLSWWILHVGWKDVGERVRRGVEEVFEGVSLKTKFAAMDLHYLIRDVRRRVEHEVTFEGCERRVNFLSALLPPTPEMIQHVLTQGGFNSEASPERSCIVQSEQDTTTTMTPSELSHEFDASPATGLSGLYNTLRNPHNIAPSPSQPPIPNPTRARCYPHREANNADQDADACVDCASLSHMRGPGARRGPFPHPPSSLSHPHPSSLLWLVQDPPFISLIEETRAIITSPDFEYVLESCLDRATAVLFDGLEKSVFVSSDSAPGEEVRIRLAGLLPGFARWSRLALYGLPNELVDNVLGLEEVTCLSAIVFSKFEERFS
ncbi:hypothetical protein AX15_001664 [Amanita polypyramis BW_CC]|nr:hypothetical protein AX15_001664 [Amanita polypyramis BW_CC]